MTQFETKFLFLILSRFFGTLAFQLLVMQSTYLIYIETKSSLMTGLIGGLGFISSLILTFFSGHMADRIKKIGKFFILIQFLLFISSVFAIHYSNMKYVFFSLVFVLFSLRTLRAPLFYKLSSLFSDDTKKHKYFLKLTTLSWQVPLLLTPLFFNYLGNEYIILFFFLSFLMSLPMFTKASEFIYSSEHLGSVIKNFVDTKKLFIASIGDSLIMVFLASFSLLPFIIHDQSLSKDLLGYIRLTFGAGVLATVWLIPKYLIEAKYIRLFFISYLFSCVILFLISFNTSNMMFFLLYFLLGILDGYSILFRDKMVFSISNPQYTGRFSSITQVLNTMTDDLGEFRAGVFADLFGPQLGIRLSSIIALITTLVFIKKTDSTVSE